MTEEQRARRAATARQNGAKSRGPVTPTGKQISALNSITTGEHLNLLAEELPECLTMLTTDDAVAFVRLLQKHLRQYQPQSECEKTLLRQMTVELFQAQRTISLETYARQSDLDTMMRRYPDLEDQERQLQAYKEGLREEKLWRALQRDKKAHQTAYLQYQRALQTMRRAFPLVPPEPVSLTVDLQQLECPMPSPEVIAEVLEHADQAKSEPSYPLPRWVRGMLEDDELMEQIAPEYDRTGIPGLAVETKQAISERLQIASQHESEPRIREASNSLQAMETKEESVPEAAQSYQLKTNATPEIEPSRPGPVQSPQTRGSEADQQESEPRKPGALKSRQTTENKEESTPKADHSNRCQIDETVEMEPSRPRPGGSPQTPGSEPDHELLQIAVRAKNEPGFVVPLWAAEMLSDQEFMAEIAPGFDLADLPERLRRQLPRAA